MSSVLFPESPRSFPGRRGLKILLRAIHVLFAGVLVGAYVFEVEAVSRAPWLLGTIGSGILIFLLDLHESAAFLLQVRGLIVLAKIFAVCLLPWCTGWEVQMLGALVVISVLSSHAPSSFRYFLVIGRGQVEAAKSKG